MLFSYQSLLVTFSVIDCRTLPLITDTMRSFKINVGIESNRQDYKQEINNHLRNFLSTHIPKRINSISH